jgi:hypothetical protein
MKTKTFNAIIDGKNREMLIRSPSLQDQKEATKVYNQTFSEALKAKAVVRAKLDDLLIEQGLWDGIKQAKFTELQAEILDGERKLAKGGISLSDAKDIALKMRKTREDLRELIAVKTNLDTHTAEGQADNARFNYLVSACTVYNDTKEQYFKSYEDYNNKSGDPVAILAAQNLANMLYGLEDNYEEKLPENKFLKQYKFVDSKLRLINKEGKLVDENGRLIDENGRYINEQGQFIDKDGNLVDQAGDYIIEFTPFLDDEGKPVVLETNKKEEDNNAQTSSENKSISTEINEPEKTVESKENK